MSNDDLKALHAIWASITVLKDRSYSEFEQIVSGFVSYCAAHSEMERMSSANIMVIPHRENGKLISFRVAICSHIEFSLDDIPLNKAAPKVSPS